MITLPICFLTEQQEQLEELGIQFDDTETDIIDVTFFNIDLIFESYGETIISSGGNLYVCPWKKKDVINAIKNSNITYKIINTDISNFGPK